MEDHGLRNSHMGQVFTCIHNILKLDCCGMQNVRDINCISAADVRIKLYCLVPVARAKESTRCSEST